MLMTIANLAFLGALALSAPTDAGSAIATLEGQWEGELEYRDYQSDTLSTIPMSTTFESVPDGVTFIQRDTFLDPRRAVHVTSLYMVADDAVSQANARAGREFESYALAARMTAADAADRWGMSFTRVASDANRPASIRLTMERDGDRLTITKDVDFLDDDTSEWLRRNQVRLMRK